MRTRTLRSRWAAIGAAVAVTIGSGGLLTASAADPPSLTFVAITPCRVVDTRPAPATVGPRSTPLGPAETYSAAFVGAVGKCTIPANASAVVLSLVVVNPTAASFLTVFPAGNALPLASNLNYEAGQAPVANSATVQIGAGGQLSFYNNGGNADVVADVSGYFLPVGAAPPRTEQILFSSRAIEFPGSASTVNNCTTTSSGVPFAVIPLNLPIGATIDSMGAVVFDSASASAYTLVLLRQRTNSTGITLSNPLLTISGGGSFGAVTSVAGASSSFPVTATDSYWIEVNLGTANANAFCSATINVTLPS